MSDFDDEPTEGLEATDETGPEANAPKPAKKPRPQPVADDDWDDDWDDDDDGGRGSKRDLTLVYAIVAAAIVIVLAVVLTRPKDDNGTASNGNGDNPAQTTAPAEAVKNWQGPVGDAVGENGKDAQKRAEEAEGVYIWTDFGGWHLRNNGAEEVTVKVTADQVRMKKTDDGDDGDEDGDAPFATETTVTLAAGEGKEGTGLDLGNSESATFTVSIGGKNAPADQIFLGGAEGVADQNPVTFVKS
ncbi:MAG: hypothetical protein JWO77_2109 [Ilumatobacteraceae bacterium]|nr:hypothetical protein [Ilumatobacteraceae bacterium]